MKTGLARSKYSMLLPAAGLHHKLLGWYDLAKRAMPWRETRDPYAIWLSETMLQQTQVETVKPYYRKFLERFPTVADLAAAQLEEVLALWAGLGYYRRAKHLHLAAREMVARHGGRVPATFDGLVSLPGVGRYTAGAVGSIAFGLAVPVVDGNVMRVISRLTGFDRDTAEPKNAAFFWAVMDQVLEGASSQPPVVSSQQGGKGAGRHPSIPSNGEAIPSGGGAIPFDPVRGPGKLEVLGPRYGDLNQAVMELGATVCVPPPGAPGCLVCPVREWCRASAEGRVMELPVKRRKGEVPEVRGVAVVVVRSRKSGVGSEKHGARIKKQESRSKNQEVLLMKRPIGGVWEGMWEFPVVESFEFQGSSFKKRVREQLGMQVRNAVDCGEVRHQLTHRLMVFRVVRCEVEQPEPTHDPKPNTNRTQHSKLETGNWKPTLPSSVTAGGERYVELRWVAWPLSEASGLPFATVVWKVAERANI